VPAANRHSERLDDFMEVLAIIPARGGSKGILRKNVRLLAGKPLIAHTIEQAKAAQSISRVVVSTDDPEIAEVSRQFGAGVIERPAEISGDSASSESALLHALSWLEQSQQYQPDLVLFLQCTSPLTSAEDINGLVEAIGRDDADTAVTVTPFHYFLWKRAETGCGTGINHDSSRRPLRQEREPQFLETGAAYAMRTQGFLWAKHRFFGKTALYVMPHERCLEIDEPVDFEVAEVLLTARERQRRLDKLPTAPGAVVFDFDGVFTDNRVIVFDDGREAVQCDRSDGMGLRRLKELGIPCLVLSSEENSVVTARCRKLGLACVQGVQDKQPTLRAWLQENRLAPANAVYLGNDVNDLACLQTVGCGVAPADAHREALRAAKMVLESRGGSGAVRELCDLIVERRKSA